MLASRRIICTRTKLPVRCRAERRRKQAIGSHARDRGRETVSTTAAARDRNPRAPESAQQQRGGSSHRTEHWLPVAEGNCVAESRDGERPEANDQSIFKKSEIVGVESKVSRILDDIYVGPRYVKFPQGLYIPASEVRPLAFSPSRPPRVESSDSIDGKIPAAVGCHASELAESL